MKAVCSYQGSKQLIAHEIVDVLLSTSGYNDDTTFYDLCCGSGSISLELVNRGINPNKIVMVDVGPWGAFWKSVGSGTFDVRRLRSLCDQIPTDFSMVSGHMKRIATEPIDGDFVYKFLLLQACSFGGKAIWVEGTKWKHHGFRSYWIPTATSVAKVPNMPMSPMPDTLMLRMKEIASKMAGVRGCHSDVQKLFDMPINSVVYIDPPYSNHTGYSCTLNIGEFTSSLNRKCYVSEAVPLTELAYIIGTKNTRGGLSHTKNSTKKTEWLSIIE